MEQRIQTGCFSNVLFCFLQCLVLFFLSLSRCMNLDVIGWRWLCLSAGKWLNWYGEEAGLPAAASLVTRRNGFALIKAAMEVPASRKPRRRTERAV